MENEGNVTKKKKKGWRKKKRKKDYVVVQNRTFSPAVTEIVKSLKFSGVCLISTAAVSTAVSLMQVVRSSTPIVPSIGNVNPAAVMLNIADTLIESSATCSWIVSMPALFGLFCWIRVSHRWMISRSCLSRNPLLIRKFDRESISSSLSVSALIDQLPSLWWIKHVSELLWFPLNFSRSESFQRIHVIFVSIEPIFVQLAVVGESIRTGQDLVVERSDGKLENGVGQLGSGGKASLIENQLATNVQPRCGARSFVLQYTLLANERDCLSLNLHNDTLSNCTDAAGDCSNNLASVDLPSI